MLDHLYCFLFRNDIDLLLRMVPLASYETVPLTLAEEAVITCEPGGFDLSCRYPPDWSEADALYLLETQVIPKIRIARLAKRMGGSGAANPVAGEGG